MTTVGVAVVAHELIAGLTWPSAFVLGAIVSPTDPIAATAIARRLGVPRRLVTVVEGESLVNDGTGLVLYRVAVAAVVAGSFSAVYTGGLFLVSAVGGVAVGIAVGWIVRQVRLRLDNPPAEITLSLLTGYFAFLPAELLGVSAVLSAVAAGVYLGWYTPELTTSQVRLQGVAVWEIVQYTLNALLFVLIGLQLPVVVEALGDIPSASASRLRGGRERHGDRTEIRLGLRGARSTEADGAKEVQLARRRLSLLGRNAWRRIARSGARAPARDRFRRVVSGPRSDSLPHLLGHPRDAGRTRADPAPVIRVLGLEDDGGDDREDAKARIRAAEAALARLEELVSEDWVRDDTVERVRGAYRFRTDRFSARFDDDDDGAIESRSQDYQRLRRELLDAERTALLELRRSGAISNEVFLRVGPRSRSRGSAPRHLGFARVSPEPRPRRSRPSDEEPRSSALGRPRRPTEKQRRLIVYGVAQVLELEPVGVDRSSSIRSTPPSRRTSITGSLQCHGSSRNSDPSVPIASSSSRSGRDVPQSKSAWTSPGKRSAPVNTQSVPLGPM